MHILQGSTERVSSKTSSQAAQQYPITFKPEKGKKEARKQHSQTGRDFMNRSALGMVGSQNDVNRIQLGRTPDRSKNYTNLSVYSTDRQVVPVPRQSQNPY